MFAGIVALDLLLYNRKTFQDILKLLDVQNPLRFLKDANKNFFVSPISCWRYVLIMASYICTIGFICYLVILVKILFDRPQATFFENVTFFTVYNSLFFLADAIFLLSILWALQYQIKNLNLFIRNLIKFEKHPKISDIEIIKKWFV